MGSFTVPNPNTVVTQGSPTGENGGTKINSSRTTMGRRKRSHGATSTPQGHWHECLVVPLRGESCDVLRRRAPAEVFPINHAQHLIISALMRLTRFHKHHMVYGAVSLDNIVTNPSLSRTNVEFLLKETNGTLRSEVERWETVNGVCYPIVRSQPLPCDRNWDSNIYLFADLDVILPNFGHVQRLKSRHGPATWARARMPRAIRPPEAILDLPYTIKSDFWQLGCAGFHLLLGEEFVPAEMAVDDKTLMSWIVAMCGPIPPEMAARSSVASSYLDAHGVPHDQLFPVGPLLEARVREKGVVPEEEIPGVMWFLNACLTLDPKARINVDKLWGSDWLRAAAWDWH